MRKHKITKAIAEATELWPTEAFGKSETKKVPVCARHYKELSRRRAKA